VRLAEVAGMYGIGVLFDAVLNHKARADFSEEVKAVRIDPKDRNREIGGTGEEGIIAWTGYEFPGRKGVYSPLR